LAHPPAAEPATLAYLPVLFIPGTLCTRAVFDAQIDMFSQLAAQVDVVEYSVEDTISKMADTAIKKISSRDGAAIIGFSMGGMVAMEIARRAPELIRKLALLNTNSHADPPERQAGRMQHLREAKSAGMASVIRQYYLGRYLHKASPRSRNLIVRMATELGSECFATQIRALTTRQDSSTALSNIKCPTLILGSLQDQLCHPDEQIQMQQKIEDGTLVMLDECGHFSTLEKPLAVNKALRDWYL
jgi:pimeloyl-ACP methyl ester carboxylesterase